MIQTEGREREKDKEGLLQGSLKLYSLFLWVLQGKGGDGWILVLPAVHTMRSCMGENYYDTEVFDRNLLASES